MDVEIDEHDRRRALKVTVGLAVVGAAFGGAAGVAAMAFAQFLQGGVTAVRFARLIYPFALLAGAALGAVGAPILGWLLLREVPVGRVAAWLTLGALAGGTVALLLEGPFGVLYGPVVCAGVGALLAGLLLRIRDRSGRRTGRTEAGPPRK